MISGNAFFLLGNYFTLLCGAHSDLVESLVQFRIAYKLFIRTCCKYCGLVQKIGKVCTGEARAQTGNVP